MPAGGMLAHGRMMARRVGDVGEAGAEMPRKLRQLRAELRRAGARIVHQAGSHEKWGHALVPDFTFELAGHDGDDAYAYQEKLTRTLLARIADATRRQQP